MRGILAAIIILASLMAGGCGRDLGAKALPSTKQEAVPVRITRAISRDVPTEVSTIGTVEAFSTIQVKAQVSGEIKKVWFSEGDEVKKDQVLFTIDTRPFEADLQQVEADQAKYRAQLEQAQANWAKDAALAVNAEEELKRRASLHDQGVVTQEELDKIKATADSLRAAVRADEAASRVAEAAIAGASAALEKARIELDYCTIRSPIDGKTGSILLHAGNLVKANDTPSLLVINQVSPISVSFNLPETDLSRLKRAMFERPLQATAIIPPATVASATGDLKFLDNAVNQKTGTIRLKATFRNEDRTLWPGQFVNVRLAIGIQPSAVVIPAQAVQTGQSGPYVYLVKPDDTVEVRNVVLGASRDTMTIVREGLSPGEVVVTDGHVRLAPGVAVKVAPENGNGGKAQG